MYFLELNDIIFLIKSIKLPYPGFNILDYVSFTCTSSSTRSSTFHKLWHTKSSTNLISNLYFNHMELSPPRLTMLPPFTNKIDDRKIPVFSFWFTFQPIWSLHLSFLMSMFKIPIITTLKLYLIKLAGSGKCYYDVSTLILHTII